ncbi:MAG: sulfatase-like hydrolase/transferase [Victivallales bacterium]|nr:sulfatase-like hydrolase/transferase [Victivallales bacterium]
MRTTLLSLLLALSGALLPAAPPRPNVVVIVADDLGYGDVSYQGGDVATPRIDSIARNGVTFTDGYVTCAVCAPSRAGLLTGQYQQRFGFWDNIGPYRRGKNIEPGIPTDLPILSERLKKLGYTTGIFGKTHDGAAEEMMAFNRWDEFYGFNNGASNFLGDMNRSSNPIYHNRTVVSSPYTARGIKHTDVCQKGVIVKDADQYLTDKLGEMAVRFIETNKDRSFLCYVPFNAIHGPFQAPKELVDKYAHIKNPERRRVMAMLESMDQNVGRVLDALKKHGLMENTLIVFLSDNGGHKASPNKPLRGKKGTFWEGGLRVPFCMRWDGRIKSGQIYRRPVIALDILPTAMAAAGVSADPAWELDGVDLLPYVRDGKAGDPHEALHWAWGPRTAIRRGDLKAVSMNKGKTFMLFDLAKDIGEQHDLAAERPEELAALTKMHRQWEKALMPPQWGWNKALGYRDPAFGKPKSYQREQTPRPAGTTRKGNEQ